MKLRIKDRVRRKISGPDAPYSGMVIAINEGLINDTCVFWGGDIGQSWVRHLDLECERDAVARDPVVQRVREELLSRSNVGLRKYGVGLDRKDLSPVEWLEHFRQELMDGVLYATRLQQDLEAKK